MHDLPDIEIALAVTAKRATNVLAENLPRIRCTRYSIHCQGISSIAVTHLANLASIRSDISVFYSKDRGAAANRNAALKLSSSSILIFADDDSKINIDGINDLRSAALDFPHDAVLVGRSVTPTGELRKRFPPHSTKLNLFNSAKVGTIELAVRPAAIREKGVLFDTRFGAGAPLHLGDEYIFIADSMRAGLTGRWIDAIIASHSEMSSGTEWLTAASAISRSKVFERVFGWASGPIKIVFLCLHLRRFQSIGQIMVFATHFLGLPYKGKVQSEVSTTDVGVK